MINSPAVLNFKKEKKKGECRRKKRVRQGKEGKMRQMKIK